GFNAAIAAFEAMTRHQVTAPLVFWLLIFWVGVMVPRGVGLAAVQQWFAVPGGAVYRRARRRRGWELHVFRRNSSMLCFFPAMRRACGVSIADSTTQARTTITAREAELLLRAWLSPLEPPDEDKLSDLA